VSDAPPSAYAIGLDVGGTKIAGGVVAFPEGRIVARATIPTAPARGGDVVLRDAVALAARLRREAGAVEICGVGVGVPELVDPGGTITSAHSLAWRGVHIATPFHSIAPAVVESDVRAAALAEALLGAGRSFSTFAYVSVGTGISYSLVQDGRVYAGARGNALVLASSPLTTICTVCGTTLHPVLEEFASGPALVARYNKEAEEPVERAEDVFDAVIDGDLHAALVIRTGGEALGVSIGFLVNVLDPGAVVVGGGLGQAPGLYFASALHATREHIWADTSRDLPILQAGLGADAGLIGAAATAWRRMTS
jgi:glucokinase